MLGGKNQNNNKKKTFFYGQLHNSKQNNPTVKKKIIFFFLCNLLTTYLRDSSWVCAPLLQREIASSESSDGTRVKKRVEELEQEHKDRTRSGREQVLFRI